MQLRVPHGYQPNDYTCGPKSLWMVLRYFKKRVSMAELMRLCETTEKTGTRRAMMKRALQNLHFTVHSSHHASLRDIERWIGKGVPVIIDFREWEEDIVHFAVVVGVTGTRITLNDPAHGAGITISHKEFLERWYGKHHTRHTHWMLAAHPKK